MDQASKMISIKIKLLRNLIFLGITLSYMSACSMAKITVRASMPMIEGGITAINRENDLLLAEAAMPANIELMEGMLINDPNNDTLRTYAAQAYYGYSFGFIEDTNPVRASRLYYRGFKHGIMALEEHGLSNTDIVGPLDTLQAVINKMDRDATAALFWTASCLAKWVDLNRDNAQSIAQLPKAVMLMQRVLQLDEHYYMSGANIFFGVYYGSRSPMMGGNFEKSRYFFEKAKNYNNDKLLLIGLLKSQYLYRQQLDKKAFHNTLTKILNAPVDIFPQQALITMIAKQKAALLLNKEEQWF